MWRVITEEDVQKAFSEPELAGIAAAAIRPGQDVVAELVTDAVNQARGYIADNPVNQLAAGETLPERCIRAALHLVRPDFLTRVDMEVSEDRRIAAANALAFFKDVAKGNVTLEQPEGPVEDSGAAPKMTTVATRKVVASRDKLAGL